MKVRVSTNGIKEGLHRSTDLCRQNRACMASMLNLAIVKFFLSGLSFVQTSCLVHLEYIWRPPIFLPFWRLHHTSKRLQEWVIPYCPKTYFSPHFETSPFLCSDDESMCTLPFMHGVKFLHHDSSICLEHNMHGGDQEMHISSHSTLGRWELPSRSESSSPPHSYGWSHQ